MESTFRAAIPRVPSASNAAELSDTPAALGAAAWLEQNLLKAAAELAAVGRARPGFEKGVADIFRKAPIQAWEADRWLRGMKLRLIRMEAFFFRAGTQKRSALSLFVRNERGLNVGLRREAITQMATYVSMITDLGYDRNQTRFESRFMDVLVTDREDRPWIYAENKASARTLERLCARLTSDFAEGIPFVANDAPIAGVDDAIMKANHIWNHRPSYFWAVSPTSRRAFQVAYSEAGFRLVETPQIPTVDEQPALPAF